MSGKHNGIEWEVSTINLGFVINSHTPTSSDESVSYCLGPWAKVSSVVTRKSQVETIIIMLFMVSYYLTSSIVAIYSSKALGHDIRIKIHVVSGHS